MGDLSDFQRGYIVRARLAGASVTKTVASLGVSRAAVSIVMTARTNHGKTYPSTRTCGRNPKLSGRDRRALKRILSKNDRTTATKVTAELITHLEHPVRRQFHKSTSTVELLLLNLRLPKTIKGEKDGVIIIKPGRVMIGSM
jgi:transposase